MYLPLGIGGDGTKDVLGIRRLRAGFEKIVVDVQAAIPSS